MPATPPRTSGVAPLAELLSGTTGAVRDLAAGRGATSYVFDMHSNGDAVVVIGADLMGTPTGTNTKTPSFASTGLTGAGIAVKAGSAVSTTLSCVSGDYQATFASTAGLLAGGAIVCDAFPAGTTVQAVSGTTVTLSQPASSSATDIAVSTTGWASLAAAIAAIFGF